MPPWLIAFLSLTAAVLAIKLARELRPGAVVASANFPLPGWQPQKILRPWGDRHRGPIYIYRLPSALAGPFSQTRA